MSDAESIYELAAEFALGFEKYHVGVMVNEMEPYSDAVESSVEINAVRWKIIPSFF